MHFAGLHDTPGVMKAKNVIKQVVPWAESREFFAKQLRRRLAEERLKTLAAAAHPEADAAVVLADMAAHVEARARSPRSLRCRACALARSPDVSAVPPNSTMPSRRRCQGSSRLASPHFCAAGRSACRPWSA